MERTLWLSLTYLVIVHIEEVLDRGALLTDHLPLGVLSMITRTRLGCIGSEFGSAGLTAPVPATKQRVAGTRIGVFGMVEWMVGSKTARFEDTVSTLLLVFIFFILI